MTQPILRFIEGIDPDGQSRELTQEEVDQLIRADNATGKLGDWFAQWLANTPVDQRQLSLRSLLTEVLPTGSYKPFAVADGIPIVYDSKNTTKPLNSVNRHVRFVIVALPDSSSTLDLSDAIMKRTLCIVGSSYPDGKSQDEGAFLQCASWDPNALGKRMGLMRFYQRNDDGWIYFGDSFNAFKSASDEKGAFDGHVGGALIMKELTVPWTHWYNSINVNEFVNSLGSTPDKGSLCDPHNVLYDPLFTSNGVPFSLLGRAEDFEQIVRNAVIKWYISRFTHDFVDPNTKKPFAEISTVIKQWVGHILLNRSMNIAASATSSAQVRANADVAGVPPTLFFNSNALQCVLPDVGPKNAYTASNNVYVAVVAALKLSLFYTDSDSTPKLAVEGSEGPFAFPIIEPGLEDYQGIRTLISRSSVATLLSPKAIAAMLMVDFCNPLYSARRECLIQYLPDTANFDSTTKTYDVLDKFTANVRASSASSDTQSPEYEILQLLATSDDSYVDTFTKRVNAYLAKVDARFKKNTTEALQDYVALAEGRRLLYKGRENAKPDGSGLNEFQLTLPVAAQPVPISKMTEDGNVEVMLAEEIAIIAKEKASSCTSLRVCPMRSRRTGPRL